MKNSKTIVKCIQDIFKNNCPEDVYNEYTVSSTPDIIKSQIIHVLEITKHRKAPGPVYLFKY